MVRRRNGTQASDMTPMVMNGDGSVQPMVAHACSMRSTSAATTSTGLSLMRPQTGSSTRASTLPSMTATSPPPQSASVLAASAMSASLSPMTRRLWASWLTVWASAPWMPKPLMKPKACAPFSPWCLSNTQAFRMSCSGSAWSEPSRTGTWTVSSRVRVSPALTPSARTLHVSSCVSTGMRNVCDVMSMPRSMVLVMKLGHWNGSTSNRALPSFATSSPSM